MTRARAAMMPMIDARTSFMVFEYGFLYPERVGLTGCRIQVAYCVASQ
jgi:hypothetical protein